MMLFFESVVTVALRRAFSFAGGAIVLTDEQMAQVVGAVLIVGDLLWQAWKHHQATRDDALKGRA